MKKLAAGSKFDVAGFGAKLAYTVDGEALGEISNETWSARTATVTFKGKSTHPGTAKNIMVNAMYAAADSAGNLYVTWQDDKWNQPYLAVSRDLGKHWSTPVMVAPPGVMLTNFPSLAAGDNGRVVITFPGSTDVNANKKIGKTAPWHYYVVETQNALAARPTFVSQIAPIPSALGGGSTIMHRGACHGRCGGLFDFLDVQVAPTAGGAAYASLSDDCTGPCAKLPAGTSTDKSAGQGILVRQVAGPALTGHATRLGKQKFVFGSSVPAGSRPSDTATTACSSRGSSSPWSGPGCSRSPRRGSSCSSPVTRSGSASWPRRSSCRS